MLACNVQLLLDALSEKNADKASTACADAADQLKKISHLMVEFDDTYTSPTTKLWLDVHGHGDDPEAVHPC